MSRLILPMDVYRAKVDQMYKESSEYKVISELKDIENQLKQLNDKLKLVYIESEEAAFQIPRSKAGYWHVFLEHDPPTPPTIFPVQNDDGTPTAPGQWLVERFKQFNMRDSRVMREMRNRQDQIERSEARQKENESDGRADEMYLRYKSMTNPSYNFGTKGWTNKANKRGAGTR